MRYIYLVLLMVALVGCVEPDPMRAAIANERNKQAENTQAAQQAQISQAQAAQDDARRSQELLLTLQSQNAIVQSQSAQAQALAQVEIARTIAEATKPDYTLPIVVICALTLVTVVWLMVNRRPGSSVAAPKLLFRSAHAEAWLLVDGTIHLRRLRDGQARVYLPSDELYSKLLTGGK